MNETQMTFTRRALGGEMLRVGALSAFSYGLTDWFSQRSLRAEMPIHAAKADACILIWLDGGPSHLDLFDLKPDAPAEVRGPFSPIRTKVDGLQLCEYMPETAKLAEHMTVVRSLTSPLGEHNFASHYLLTGYKPSRSLVYPSFSSAAVHLGNDQTELPTNIAVQRPNGFLGSGYLPDSTSPFVIDGDPAKPDFRVRDLSTRAGINADRLSRRQSFREAVDRFSQRAQQRATDRTEADDSFAQAFRLIHSREARAAFELEKEKSATRNRYGRHTLGQSCLMARRLVEAGVKFVTVTDRGWDTHQDLFNRLKEGFTGGTAGKIPKLDQAYSALLADLRDRGMLDSTLVLLMGEFGRTPKLNTRGGRDHWPGAFSVTLAGGGVPGGQLIGKTDASGELPSDRPVSPADLVRSVFHLMGVDPAAELKTADGRPVQVNRDGTLIDELIA
jgi:hypothetical protein